MDPNLSVPIIINATLNQPPENVFTNPGLTTLLGIVIGFVLNILFSSIQEKRKLMLDNLQQQIQAYSQLKGIIFKTSQINEFQAVTLTQLYWIKKREECNLWTGHEEYGDSNTCKQKVDEGSHDLSDVMQRLLEVIGLIEISFPNTKELEDSIKSIRKYYSKLEETQMIVEKKFKKLVFSWDKIPEDNGKLKEYLKNNFGINWVNTSEIKKSDDGASIKLSTEKNFLSLKLNNKRTKAILEVDDGRTIEFSAKMEKEMLNIYSCDRLDREELKEAEKIFRDAISENFDKPAEALEKYLKHTIKLEKSLMKPSWWQFWIKDTWHLLD
jgi:hypothetical protein